MSLKHHNISLVARKNTLRDTRKQSNEEIQRSGYPPAEQRPRARRSSNVVGSTEVRSDAESPAAPSPPTVTKN